MYGTEYELYGNIDIFNQTANIGKELQGLTDFKMFRFDIPVPINFSKIISFSYVAITRDQEISGAPEYVQHGTCILGDICQNGFGKNQISISLYINKPWYDSNKVITSKGLGIFYNVKFEI